jgi:hypothetical protein
MTSVGFSAAAAADPYIEQASETSKKDEEKGDVIAASSPVQFRPPPIDSLFLSNSFLLSLSYSLGRSMNSLPCAAALHWAHSFLLFG